jgi:hypothetical protein
MLKKIATNQVILTPTATSSVKLDEINRLVKEMESGTEALKRMQEIDSSAGMVAPDVKRQATTDFKNRQQGLPPVQASANSALDDHALAANMLVQAKRMEQDAQGLIAEAARMKKDAERMFPGVNPGDARAVPETAATAPKRGRPAKSRVTADAAIQ